MYINDIPHENCPFCDDSEIDIQRGTPDSEGIPTNIVCVMCGATGPSVYQSNKNEFMLALKQWNVRYKHKKS